MLGYLFLFLLTIFIAVFVSNNKSSLKIFYISFTVMITFNFIVHLISINNGLGGYSIFTKGILDDEIIYRETSLNIYSKISEIGNLFIQDRFFVSTSEEFNLKELAKSEFYYSFLIALGYIISGSDSIVITRFFSAIFFSLFFVKANSFLCKALNHTKIYNEVFFLFFYPTLMIRGLQIEQEMLVNYIMLSVIVGSIESRKINIKELVILCFIKIISAISLASSLINQKVNKIRLLIQLIIIPYILIICIRNSAPEFFNYILAVKSYSVMDGKMDIINVDYSSIFGILETTLISSYYFIFAPLNLNIILNGSPHFRFLLLEPIFVTIIIYYLYKNFATLKKIRGLTRTIYFAFYYSLIYIFIESHITSFMRRRIIIYTLLMLLYFLVKNIKKSKKLESNPIYKSS